MNLLGTEMTLYTMSSAFAELYLFLAFLMGVV